MACKDNIAAFRCRNCGHLEDSGHAGENMVPHACSVCGAGVILKPRLTQLSAELGNPACSEERRIAIAKELTTLGNEPKQLDPSNWEVIGEHTPMPKGAEGSAVIAVTAKDTPRTRDSN